MRCFAQDGVEVVDLRHEQTDPSPKSRVRQGRTVRRQPRSVTGIVIHQTACNFGVSRAAVRAADGDRDLAQQRRALNVANHVMAYREGWVVVANDFDRYIYHGNKFNAHSLGLEIEGLYPGVRGGPAWGGDPDLVTDTVVETAQAAISYMVHRGRAMGMPLEYIWAHRQSSANRRSDPGEELWDRVVLQHAVAKLGLRTEPALTIGNGRPIPLVWDPDGVGKY